MSEVLSTELLEAAATWYVDLLDAAPGDDIHRVHSQWLAANPAHRQAWERLQNLQQTLGKTPVSIARPVLAASGLARRRAIKTITGLLLLTGAVSAGWQRRDIVQVLAADLRTATGDRLDHRLADGGLVQLNTDTALDIRYGEELRQLILHRGEMLVTTAADARQRPFVVHTRHGSIRALGTRFVVSSDTGQCRVGVIEHAVEVRPRDAGNTPVRLEAGQQLVFGAPRVLSSAPVTPNDTAWLDGLVVASDWRLDHFAAELSRYHPGRISCVDDVAALRISGAFHVGNLDTVLVNLANALPIRVRHFTRYWVRLEAV